MSGYIVFQYPLIVIGFVDSFCLSDERIEKLKENGLYLMREEIIGTDNPDDLRNTSVKFKDKCFSEKERVGYIIDYHGVEILVIDIDGKEQEKPILPDELFELE